MSHGAVGPVRAHLFHHRVVAVLRLGLHEDYLELSRQPGL